MYGGKVRVVANRKSLKYQNDTKQKSGRNNGNVNNVIPW